MANTIQILNCLLISIVSETYVLTFSLRESDPVVEFSDKKLMKVNFSSRLAILITEVRQLISMGYRVPHPIEETTGHARKFLRYAKALEQVSLIKD